jgi:hypothetical protein
MTIRSTWRSRTRVNENGGVKRNPKMQWALRHRFLRGYLSLRISIFSYEPKLQESTESTWKV